MREKSSDYDDSSSSMILTTRFGHESTRLIHSVERNLYIVVGLIVSIAVLSVMNILGVLEYFRSSGVDRIVDVTLLGVLIAVLIPLVILLLRSRTVLENWTEMFERNAITTGMTLAMKRRSKEEAIQALAQSVDEVSEPLEEYITSGKSDLKEFLDVSVGEGKTRATYDILVDSNHVLNGGGGDDNSKGRSLRKVLEDYGAVIIKIVDDHVGRNHVESFVDSLSKYVSMSKKQVGLGMIIGEEISPEAKEFANNFISKRRLGVSIINLLLLIDKPSSPSTPQQQPTFNSTG
jgi:hypothetical protein